MNKKMYTDDTDTNYLSAKGMARVLNLSESTAKKIAEECGAKVKIGRCARYRRDILEAYINQEKRA